VPFKVGRGTVVALSVEEGVRGFGSPSTRRRWARTRVDPPAVLAEFVEGLVNCQVAGKGSG
jgi:hypothetical protein